MRIAIDARKISDFGIGTYLRGLLSAFAADQTADEFVVLIPSRARHLVASRFEPVMVDVPTYGVRELFAVARAAARARADVFHAPHINVPFVDAPIVTTLHDAIPFHFTPVWRPARWYASYMTRRAARISARVLTVSEASKRELVRVLGCTAEKIVVTPNGIDQRFFTAAAPAEPHSGRYLLYAGNDKPHKNVAGVVAAFEIVRRRYPDLRLRLCGSRFERYRRREGVELLGYVDDAELPALFHSAAVFVLPSFEEGFGLPALEAMAAGTPVVTSATPAMLEVTADAAVHVDPASPGALAEGIVRVLDDRDLNDRLRREGPQRARQFTWSRCAALTKEAYRAAIAER